MTDQQPEPPAPEPATDDESIPNEEPLWRRIKAFAGWLDPEGSPTSAAFKDNTTPQRFLSVHRSSLTTEEKIVELYPDYGIWSLLASVPRANGHVVQGSPTEQDPSHADIAPKPGLQTSGRMEGARRMAASAQMIRAIP